MTVVSITDITKQRQRVLLDTEESFVLYKSEIRTLKIREGAELTEDAYNKIVKGILPKRCKMRAMNLLKERSYTTYNLKRKLLDGGYPESIVNDTIDYVASFNYVDDLRFARMYIEEKESHLSRNEITRKLLSKGIDTRLTDEAYAQLGIEREEYNEAGTSAVEEELIKKTLAKKGYDPSMDYQDKQKILAYFYRRGFDIDKVRHIMGGYEAD